MALTVHVCCLMTGDPVWEIAGGMLAHETFKATGDTTVLRRGYASLKALVNFFNHKGNTQPNGICCTCSDICVHVIDRACHQC